MQISASPAAKPRQTKSAQIVEHILARAEPVFAEAGLAGATMAALAAATGLPRANLHYHFGTKEKLYAQVLENILALWLDASDSIRPDAEPAAALTAYIRAKMSYSRDRPFASKVFANEILHGATQLRSYLGLSLRRKVDEKAAVIEGWIAQGRMDPVDPRHLFFLLWAMTQTYADFASQMTAVLGVPRLGEAEFASGEALILQLVLRGCGLDRSKGRESP
ncbi:TetR family transcriptional regulator C-terminal domain-containing protein [Acidiphilium sp.]|uniref:TetR family transcriptional regulator C-terminal domain-containing protein n=1 Tax=Acidiphilium sp. TaxID=527 RepID=UPI003D05F336